MLANNSVINYVFDGTDKNPNSINIGGYDFHVCGFGPVRYVSYIRDGKYDKKIIKWTLLKSIFAKEVKLVSCKVFERFNILRIRHPKEAEAIRYEVICPKCWMNESDFTEYVLDSMASGF